MKGIIFCTTIQVGISAIIGLLWAIIYLLYSQNIFRPADIVCYSAGSFGGVRAGIQLRAFLSEMGMPTISSIFAISKIGDSLNEAGTSQEAALTKRVSQFLDELEWYEEALQRQRKEKG
ncbi:NADPH-dependent FMN reductase [Nostoc sp.]|uniref:NADPH-dependent FMN reductase n=1 Tax=Nostoc sp. TaxID=1180 RepID=UPI002FF8F016